MVPADRSCWGGCSWLAGPTANENNDDAETPRTPSIGVVPLGKPVDATLGLGRNAAVAGCR